jgi:N-acetyl-anhydromuramyl-L-alanine amidase AmpD
VKFIQARHFQWAQRMDIRLVVIHTMENPEKPTQAEAVAAWFASVASPMASAHVCVDSDSIVECVQPQHIAFAAPGANRDGYQIEHAGRANQTPADWSDAFSTAMLDISAHQAAVIAKRYGIPAVHLTVPEILAGAKGFVGHRDVNDAYHKSTHTDPGPYFPWDSYLARVRHYVDPEAPTDPAPPPDEVA